ncbi:hypothetical protein DS745_03265 [Anaerobacillus alkaliphilus]|uniref:Uncharacterized protein n=1 Tax=Anaerobacillus alkaliphilus TaxID=1548597 RepID=A0A4Q0VZG8_9BACI|nr:hypothetical protein [Anaerobacillus alkaliphilus]RXJ04418.1 hypothetical protein DS745_03265 [Anaerobacillus alkaliphilus]
MSTALIITGAVAIIISVITGVFTGTFLGFLLFLAGGVFIGMILFAFSQIIDNQLNILHQLQVQNEFMRQLHKILMNCPNCDYEYDNTFSSCPNCGHRKL